MQIAGDTLQGESRVAAELAREVAGTWQGQQEAGVAGISEMRGDGDGKLRGPWVPASTLALTRGVTLALGGLRVEAGRDLTCILTGSPAAVKSTGQSWARMEARSSKDLQTINAEEGVEKRETSHSVCGNVNWYSHYGE